MPTAEDLQHPLPWPETLERLRDFPTRLLTAIHGIPEQDLQHPEAQGRWSILNVVAHLGDLELVTAVRIRSILAQEHPPLVGFDQERTIDAVHASDTLAEALEQLAFHRRSNLTVVGRLSAGELERSGEHREYGSMTVRQLINRVQRHQEGHLRQIEGVKTTLRLRASETFDVSGIASAHAATADVRNYAPGIRIRELWHSGVKRAIQVELDPGAKWPGIDYHVPGPEELYVISGDFHDGERAYEAGSFIHHPAGSSHVPQSKTGCTLFVFYPEG